MFTGLQCWEIENFLPNPVEEGENFIVCYDLVFSLALTLQNI